MCGIAGFINSTSLWSVDQRKAVARKMAEAIAHRGPDDDGVWVEENLGVALAHRRLSIIDLSEHGHQPMVSVSGRYVIAFNGEIYNFSELRSELGRAGAVVAWRGHSDTEVFLAACELWGVEEAIRRSNGMFAIAIWDSHERCLVLIRDRVGEKPLYYGWVGKALVFGSELKAIESYPEFESNVDQISVAMFLRFGYVPAPRSIYEGIQKLRPGEILRIPVEGAQGREIRSYYWRFPRPAATASRDVGAVVDQLHGMLKTAVQSRMHAEVPLGVFLSGGVDSSMIAALMQEAAGGRVRTFSIGFSEKYHNEAVYAEAVARALGTQHEEMYVSDRDALEVVPNLSRIFDEPFADSSQIPTFLLAKLTRRHVTVALSGDGGDELFGGYVRYAHVRKLQLLYKATPSFVRRGFSAGFGRLTETLWGRGRDSAPPGFGVVFSPARIEKLRRILGASGYREMYAELISHWRNPRLVGPMLPDSDMPMENEGLAADIDSPISWMMYLDSTMYLPDDILVKVDRASMAASLEARAPFLDHRLVEYAATVPESLKLRNGQGKWILRQVLYRYVDPKLIERPKQGFAVPLASWLRGPLREWSEELLSERALSSSGMLCPTVVRRQWLAHLSGRESNEGRLWAVLMLQSWVRRARFRGGVA